MGLCFAFLKCTLAPAFLVLFLNSCKQAEGWWVEHALLAMQVGLAVALWAMRVDLLSKWGRTHNANVIALIEHDGADGGRHCAYAEAVCDAGLGGGGDLAAEVLGGGGEGAEARGAALKARAAKLVCDDATSKATLAALLAFAERGKADYDLDVRVWVLNCVAFCGYAVFPLTYFGPFARDPFHEWFGNFAGDLARTPAPKPVEWPHGLTRASPAGLDHRARHRPPRRLRGQDRGRDGQEDRLGRRRPARRGWRARRATNDGEHVVPPMGHAA